MMLFLLRLIAWGSLLLIFLLLEALLFVDQWYQLLFITALLTIVPLLAVWQLTGRNFFKSTFWNFLITPLVLVNSGWLFLIFVEDRLLQQLTIAVLSISLFIFLKVIFFYLHLRPKYQVHALENISNYLNLITMFLLASGLFNLLIFLDFSFWFCLALVTVATAALSYQIFWASELSALTAWPYIVIITVIVAQFFSVVHFLPTSVYVNGLLIADSYYVTAGLSRNWLLKIKERSVFIRYVAVGGICLLVILLTAKWI